MKIKNLSELGKAINKKDENLLIKALKSNDFKLAVKTAESIKNINNIDTINLKKLGEAYYLQAKNLHFNEGKRYSINYLKKAIQYKRNFSIAQNRLELINSYFRSYQDRTIIHDGEKVLVGPYQIRQAEFRDFRINLNITCWVECDYEFGEGFYNCAKCKRLVQTPLKSLKSKEDIEKIHKVGIYRWRGDRQASETYSDLLRTFKSKNPNIGKYFGRLLGDYLERHDESINQVDILAAVPADPVRWPNRRYNPPSVLARELSRFICVPFIDSLLKKLPSERAKDLTFEQIKNNFIVQSNRERRVNGRIVLLVDDIVTRGYTLNSCARVLKNKLGAAEVVGAVLAQSVSS